MLYNFHILKNATQATKLICIFSERIQFISGVVNISLVVSYLNDIGSLKDGRSLNDLSK